MKKYFCYRSKKMFRALRVYLAIVVVVVSIVVVVLATSLPLVHC